MRRIAALVLLLVFALPITAHAQAIQPQASPSQAGGGRTSWRDHLWHFEDMLYFEPLRADPRAAKMQLIVPAWSKAFPHSLEPGTRFVWQITLGRELPLVGWRTDTTGQRVDRGEFGVGLWAPVSFHMIEDHKDESAPIVDTDYRFGFMTKAQYGLGSDMWLGVRYTPWAHESTHLGDEYTVFASQGPEFERINVSFEYQEYGVSLEKAFGDSSMITLRHGGIALHGTDGYYSDHLLGDPTPSLSVSEKNFEPSLGFELRGWERSGRVMFVSVDTRHKLAYQFHRNPGQAETKHWSTSIAVGRSVVEGAGARRSVLLRDYFFHYYRGVNPYGQLRSQSDFWSVGVGWIFGI